MERVKKRVDQRLAWVLLTPLFMAMAVLALTLPAEAQSYSVPSGTVTETQGYYVHCGNSVTVEATFYNPSTSSFGWNAECTQSDSTVCSVSYVGITGATIGSGAGDYLRFAYKVTGLKTGQSLVCIKYGNNLSLVTVIVTKGTVETPEGQTLVYNGKDQTGLQEGSAYSISGEASATNAGSYTAIVSLKDTSSYSWSDGTTANKTVTWSIAKAKAAVPVGGTFTYDGTSHQGVAEGEAHKVSGTESATDAGDYAATVSLRDPANYTWTDGTSEDKTVFWSIAKAPQRLSAKAKTKKVKAPSLKKKAKSARVITVSGSIGDLSFEKVSGSSKIKVDARTGKLIIAKKSKVGTYKVKIKVTASGDANHEAATTSVTVKVKVTK